MDTRQVRKRPCTEGRLTYAECKAEGRDEKYQLKVVGDSSFYKRLGFIVGKDRKTLTMAAENNDVYRDNNGNVISRKQNGKVLTEQEEQQEK